MSKGQILSRLRADGHITDEEYKELKAESYKTGHWIDTNTEQEWYDKEFVCSECKGHMLGTSDFCPYCGARMKSEEERMTREEAIKVLEMFLHKQCDLERTKFAYDANTVWEAVNMASEALEQESKTEWIPCNKKLPDKSGDYLTTVRVKSTNKTFMDSSNFDADGIIKKWDWVEEYEVLAWMPLPSIYNAEKRGIRDE